MTPMRTRQVCSRARPSQPCLVLSTVLLLLLPLLVPLPLFPSTLAVTRCAISLSPTVTLCAISLSPTVPPAPARSHSPLRGSRFAR